MSVHIISLQSKKSVSFQRGDHHFFAAPSLFPVTAFTPELTADAVVLITVPAADTVVDTTASATAITVQPEKETVSVAMTTTDRQCICGSSK